MNLELALKALSFDKSRLIDFVKSLNPGEQYEPMQEMSDTQKFGRCTSYTHELLVKFLDEDTWLECYQDSWAEHSSYIFADSYKCGKYRIAQKVASDEINSNIQSTQSIIDSLIEGSYVEMPHLNRQTNSRAALDLLSSLGSSIKMQYYHCWANADLQGFKIIETQAPKHIPFNPFQKNFYGYLNNKIHPELLNYLEDKGFMDADTKKEFNKRASTVFLAQFIMLLTPVPVYMKPYTNKKSLALWQAIEGKTLAQICDNGSHHIEHTLPELQDTGSASIFFNLFFKDANSIRILQNTTTYELNHAEINLYLSLDPKYAAAPSKCFLSGLVLPVEIKSERIDAQKVISLAQHNYRVSAIELEKKLLDFQIVQSQKNPSVLKI